LLRIKQNSLAIQSQYKNKLLSYIFYAAILIFGDPGLQVYVMKTGLLVCGCGTGDNSFVKEVLLIYLTFGAATGWNTCRQPRKSSLKAGYVKFSKNDNLINQQAGFFSNEFYRC